jgi:hypothetical protein
MKEIVVPKNIEASTFCSVVDELGVSLAIQVAENLTISLGWRSGKLTLVPITGMWDS